MAENGILNRFKTRRFILGLWQIVLITSSVLLAFAINNWNESRKKKQEQIETLKAIRKGIENDLVDLRINANDYKETAQGVQYLRKAVVKGQYDPDSLESVLVDAINPSFFLSNPGPFETLKSRGVELVESDSLRDLISNYYHFTYQLIARYEQHSIEFTYNVIRPFIFNNIDFSGTGARLVDPESMRQDRSLDGELGYAQSVATLNWQANLQEIGKAEDLLAYLNEQIAKLED